GVPLVDRRVELEAGVGARPGGLGDSAPQVSGLDGAAGVAGGALLQLPVAVFHRGLDEVVRDADRVAGVLPGTGGVGLAVDVGGYAAVLDVEAGLVFFDLLPADEGLDVGMVDVEDDHLGRPPGSAAGLDGAGGAI